MKLDVYLNAKSRDCALVERFFELVARERVPAALEFPYPFQAETPECTYRKPHEVIVRCLAEPTAKYALYWNSRDRDWPEGTVVSLGFAEDGSLVFGIQTEERALEKARQTLKQLAEGPLAVYANSPPPLTREDLGEVFQPAVA